ncbi:hypothetical protein L6R52_08570 [Myxococcota bacterium]|nr:hypothetical protein [Myxococcota bacterium]
MPRSLLVPLPLAVLIALAACSDDTTEQPDAGTHPDAAEPAPDAAEPDAGGHPDATEPDASAPLELCDDARYVRQPLKPGDGTYLFGDVAGDFSVMQLDGTSWTFGEQWDGCSSYVFLSFIPTRGSTEEQVFDSAIDPLILGTPLDSHFFFVSWEGTEELRRARIEGVQQKIETFLARISEEDAAKQRARFHYVVDRGLDIPGSLGAFFTDYLAYANDPSSYVDLGERGMAPPPLPFALGIDRDQRWDAGESLSEYVGGRSSFRMASYLPLFYDYKARIRDALVLEPPAYSVTLVDTTTTARVVTTAVTLPTAAELEGIDTLEADIRIVCPHRNVFGCSEWDRIAYVHVCDDDACTTATEVVRWITPYWRRGEQRWLTNASALLGLMRDGGRRTFRVTLGPEWERPTEWEVQVSLHFSNKAQGARSTGAVRAFTGGSFGADYNTREPFTFTPPATATRVELVVILSGHGQVEGNNCAEWCDHRHQFTVDGTALPELRHEGRIGSIDGCGPLAAEGVPPGQWGNWAPERAYWCPGLPVEHVRIDLTGLVTPGQQSTLTYAASFGTAAPSGGDIDLSAYVAWFE